MNTSTVIRNIFNLSNEHIKKNARKTKIGQVFIDALITSTSEGIEDRSYQIEQLARICIESGFKPSIRIVTSHWCLIGVEAVRQINAQADIKVLPSIIRKASHIKHDGLIELAKLQEKAATRIIEANIEVRTTREPSIPYEAITIAIEGEGEAALTTTIIAPSHISIPIDRCIAFIAEDDLARQVQDSFDKAIWATAETIDISAIPSEGEISSTAIKEIIA